MIITILSKGKQISRESIQRLDLLLLALETIDLNGAESLFSLSGKLNLNKVLPNKISIWKLRNNNSMRNSFNNNKIKLDTLFEKIFTKYNPDSRVRSRTVAIVNDIIRLTGRIDFMIKNVSGKKNSQIARPILSILRIGFYEIFMDDHIPDLSLIHI